MAKESSFDVVSSIDMQEVDNAYQQCVRKLGQRYDLKDSGATIELSKSERTFTITAPSDFVANQVIDILGSKLVRRSVDLKAIRWDVPVSAAGASVRVLGHIMQGIDKDTIKRIAKDIRDMKLKVKVTIESDKIRVSSNSRDTLQNVIAFLRDTDYGIPLQYVNYR